MHLEQRWFEKVHDWEQALRLYNVQLEKTPENFEVALGKMRCMEALGEWCVISKTFSANLVSLSLFKLDLGFHLHIFRAVDINVS